MWEGGGGGGWKVKRRRKSERDEVSIWAQFQTKAKDLKLTECEQKNERKRKEKVDEWIVWTFSWLYKCIDGYLFSWNSLSLPFLFFSLIFVEKKSFLLKESKKKYRIENCRILFVVNKWMHILNIIYSPLLSFPSPFHLFREKDTPTFEKRQKLKRCPNLCVCVFGYCRILFIILHSSRHFCVFLVGS